jgi:glycosyltransferase involved in cell wall biosynthesis
VPHLVLACRVASAAVVVACNTDVAATLRVAGAEPRLVGHGVDVARFRPAPPARRPALRLLAVGRLVEKKGFDVLVEAMAHLGEDVRLTIVGDGPHQARLMAAVRRQGLGGRVTMMGTTTHDELPAMYAAADVIVVPSRVDRREDRDGLPNVVLEAMACGRPVVASDVAAIGTAVRGGVTGLLVPPEDPRALAEAIDVLHRDPVWRIRMGAQARADAVAHRGLDASAAAFIDTLERAYG